MRDEKEKEDFGERSRIRDFVLQNRWKNCTTCNFCGYISIFEVMGIGTGVIPVPVFV